MRLTYKAVTKDGKIIRGVIEAKNASDAGSYLRTKSILPIHITSERKNDIASFIPFLSKTKKSDVVFFTSQLSSMLVSGLTLMQALNVLKEQMQNQGFADIVQSIITDMEDGRSFSQAIAKYPEIFSTIYVSLIKAAEQSGLLDKVTARLADNLEKEQQLRATIKGALLYPIIVVLGMVGVIAIMMIFVIPQLTSVYTSLNVELPLTTKIVIAMSNATSTYWPILIGAAILFMLLTRRIRNSESGKRISDSLVLKLPVFGKLIQQSMLSEFSRTFGILIGSGTLVVDSLQQVSSVVGNELYKEAIQNMANGVEKGLSVADAMQSSLLFPPMVRQMVKIGEQTGKLDESLLKLSEYYDREVTQATKTLTTALEPIILVVLGASVGFLIISIITPIYSLINSIK